MKKLIFVLLLLGFFIVQIKIAFAAPRKCEDYYVCVCTAPLRCNYEWFGADDIDKVIENLQRDFDKIECECPIEKLCNDSKGVCKP